MSIEKVTIERLAMSYPKLALIKVEASGSVNTGGWSATELSELIYIRPQAMVSQGLI
jgi:hypothetical protein